MFGCILSWKIGLWNSHSQFALIFSSGITHLVNFFAFLKRISFVFTRYGNSEGTFVREINVWTNRTAISHAFICKAKLNLIGKARTLLWCHPTSWNLVRFGSPQVKSKLDDNLGGKHTSRKEPRGEWERGREGERGRERGREGERGTTLRAQFTIDLD